MARDELRSEMLREGHHATRLAAISDAAADPLRHRLHHGFKKSNARREHSGLRDRRVVETLGRPVETELRQLVPEHAVGLVEDRARGGRGLVHVAAHADGLRALPGEHESQSGHVKKA
jgi:hypothetical protein